MDHARFILAGMKGRPNGGSLFKAASPPGLLWREGKQVNGCRQERIEEIFVIGLHFSGAPTPVNMSERSVWQRLMRAVAVCLFLGLIGGIGAWFFRRSIIDYLSFRSGLEWLGPLGPPSYSWELRLGLFFAGFVGLVSALIPPLVSLLRVANGVLGMICCLLAFFSGGWEPSLELYLQGLQVAVAKPELRSGLEDLREQAAEHTGDQEFEPKVPMELVKAFGPPDFVVGRGNHIRLIWGHHRSVGNRMILIEPEPPFRSGTKVFENVHVSITEPF